MALRYFEDAAPSTTQKRTAPPVVIEETVTVTQLPSEARGFVGKDPANWSWSDLRDYVVHQIEQRFGLFPRDSKKEYGIFTRFLREHGAQAGPIAVHAFEVCDGYWANAPISINRFCKASDPYFAAPIKERLAESGPRGW